MTYANIFRTYANASPFSIFPLSSVIPIKRLSYIQSISISCNFMLFNKDKMNEKNMLDSDRCVKNKNNMYVLKMICLLC